MILKIRYFKLSRALFAKTASIIIILFGLLALIGWQFDIHALKGVLPFWSTMKANAALGFFLAGISMFLLSLKQKNQSSAIAAKILAAFVFLIGFLSLMEYVFNADFAIDQILYKEIEGAVKTIIPGRMAFNLALGLMFAGIAIFLARERKEPYNSILYGTNFFILVIGTLAVLGYIFNISILLQLGGSNTIAINASIGLIIIPLGIFLISPKKKIEKTIIEWRFIIMFSVLALIVVITSIITLRKHDKHTESSESVLHSLSTIIKAEQALYSAVNIESGSRGLVITGDETFLEPFNDTTEIQKLIVELKKLTSDNLYILQKLDTLQLLIAERIAFDMETISIRKEKGLLSASSRIESRDGKIITDKIRNIGEKIIAQELIILNQRNEIAKIDLEKATLIETVKIFVGLGFLIFIYLQISNYINGRRKAQDLLKRNNENLEQTIKERTSEIKSALQLNLSILESAGDGIYGLDLDDNATFVNQAAADILGYTKEELIGKLMHAIHHHHRADGSEYPISECPTHSTLKAELTYTITDEVFWRKDGTPISVEYVSTPVYMDEKVSGAVVVFKDITERKKAGQELKLREEKYRIISDISSDVLWEWIADTNELIFSKKFHELFGCSQDEVNNPYETFRSFIHPADRISYDNFLNKMLEVGGKNIFSFDYRILRKDETVIFVNERASVIRDNNGKAIRMLGTITDITHKKLAEEKIKNINLELELKVVSRTEELYALNKNLQNEVYEKSQLSRELEIRQTRLMNQNEELLHAQKAINEAHEKYFDLYNLAPVGYLTISEEGIILEANQLCAKLFGYEMDQIKNKALTQFIIKEDHKLYYNIKKQLQDTGIRQSLELRMKRKNGKEFWANMEAILSKGLDGKTNCSATISDISDRKQDQEKIYKAKFEAEQANRAKSDFLANMSHEIRTPLNAVLGYSEILSRLIDNPTQIDYLNSIRSSGKTLLSLINDILDLSKIEAGKFNIQVDEVNMAEILAEVQNTYLEKTNNKGIDFTLNIPVNFPKYVILDELRIKQVILNLSSNAVKFTERGYINLSLKIKKLSKERIDFEISIKDSGIGISEGFQKRIFEPFEQQEGQDSRKYGGTGLGLAITKRIVTMLGAEISLKSEQNKGSEFVIHFKNVPIADESGVNKTIENLFNPDLITFFSPNILVVDDIFDNRKLIKGFLLPYAVHIIEAENGLDAINKMKINPPDFVFMDLRMPIMDGEEVIKIIRSNPDTAKIPVVALTASAFRTKEEEMEKSEFDGYVRKPASLLDIVEVMARFLPHNIKNKEENKKQDDSSVSMNLSAELINEIEEIVLPMVLKLQKIRPKKQVIHLAETIFELGSKYKNEAVIKYGRNLLMANATFNVEREKELIFKIPFVFK